jgi:hypothetical protein
MAKENSKYGIPTSKIEEWKKQYGTDKIMQIDISPDGKLDKDGNLINVVSCVVKKPGLAELSKATPFLNDPIQQGAILLAECWLDGDPSIQQDEELRLTAMLELNNMFNIKQATVKNL